VGQHLADEVKARSAQVLLAPTVCLHRGPLGGRNFESFSEDPYLTGKLAASYINGLQGKGVAATIKRESVDRGASHVKRADISRLCGQRAGNIQAYD
jgi:beta-glucosidase